jgi:hypothetical protein
MQAAAATGALVSVNHPKPFGPAWEYAGAVGFHAVEVWNGPWDRMNHASLRWWDQQLRAGRRVVALGGSDLHRLKSSERNLGTPTTWARVGDERTPAGVLAALRAGDVFVSTSPSGPQIFLEPEGVAVRVRVVGARHAALLLISESGVVDAKSVASDDWAVRWRSPTARGYIRAQVMDAYGQLLALSNPLYT